jgi:hypothetical protein
LRGKGRQVEEEGKRVADNPWVERLMRLGYLVRGVIYADVGVLALGVAAGVGGQTTDPKGGLTVLSGVAGGGLLLTFVAVGLAGYALWCFVCAVYDPLQRGSNPGGLAQRAGFAVAGFGYLALLVFTTQLLLGKSGGTSTPEPLVARVIGLPGGPVLVGLAGVVALGFGIGQLAGAWRARFMDDLRGKGGLNEAERQVALWLGRAGYVARGVVYALIGWFVLQAAITHDARHAKSFDGAFQALVHQPFGRVLMGLVAAGFIALGLHSFASAAWIRMTVR